MKRYHTFRTWILLPCILWGSALFCQTIEIHQIDVGSGDATLIIINKSTPTQINLLIDAGSRSAASDVLAYLQAPNGGNLGPVPYLDYVITSHYHEDHLGGFVGSKKVSYSGCTKYTGILGQPGSTTNFYAVLDKGSGAPVSTSGVYTDYTTLATTPTDRRVQVGVLTVGQFGAIARIIPPAHTIPVPVPDATQRLALGGVIYLGEDANNIPIQLRLWAVDGKVYAPNKPPTYIWNVADSAQVNRNNPGTKGNPNNWGLAWVLEYGKFRYFTGGDIGGYVTNSYLDIEDPIAAELPFYYTTPASAPGHICVFKSDHHGSEHSTSDIFLNGLKPTLCSISCGSRHGHPTQQAMDRMMADHWNAADLRFTRLRNFVTTEYHQTWNVDTAYGFTSGNVNGILTNVPPPVIAGMTSTQMTNLAYIYYLPHPPVAPPIPPNTYPIINGDIRIQVYPDDGNGHTIDQLSVFKVQWKDYQTGVWQPAKTYTCHQ